VLIIREQMTPHLPQLDNRGTESRRLLHGRGGCFPGLEHVAIDWFAPALLVTFYAEKDQNTPILDSLVEAAKGSTDVTAIVVQDRHLPRAPKRTIYGEVPREPTACEAGLNHHLALLRNQNHGFFLDMKPGRDWIRTNSSGKGVLNLFAYTCSLSVAAIAGGAESVINLDMASGALSTGRRNHQLNFDSETCARVTYLAHDLFKSWAKLKRGAPYDIIVIDPPSNQAGSFVAEKDYGKIIRRLPDLAHSETRILACLNAPHLDESFLIDRFPDYQLELKLPKAPGFEDIHPQAGLKAIVFTPSKEPH
jgi:23S rRNA (cytosine1962-C5)-methyltransferase